MFTNTKCSIYAGQDKVYTESVCLSTDVKPTTGIANGSTCIEMNTGKKFMFNEDSGEWVEVPSSGGGGGGGGGDFSTAQVTIVLEGENTEINWDSCPTVDTANDLLVGNAYADTSPTVITVPLYKGKCYWDHSVMPRVITLSGNIEEFWEGMLITGDCTITITVTA